MKLNLKPKVSKGIIFASTMKLNSLCKQQVIANNQFYMTKRLNNFIESRILTLFKGLNSNHILEPLLEQKFKDFFAIRKAIAKEKLLILNKTNTKFLEKYKLVRLISTYIELCYKSNLKSNHLLDINKRLFFILIQYNDVSNKKLHVHFNFHVILYYPSVSNMERSIRW